ncbi:hypothetical protein SODALDRAFT_323663 [Sodiomyces alkalinus F11]|uniref:Uncharacterized protein n=1 Tax=Sodiomyces alkalinus (strain CBS 110278 / VKM F-3762 / F11) TaxID=1314773 RepID=A0A3N2PXK3_SODAK|nr:hypothetical protein SODALDRAFT_323663 [Sodiomyces alkalinus F11]ROT39241.1 hypothetical protein SODALDRAFT_323663 [Sodiomyces alkalinus F11]
MTPPRGPSLAQARHFTNSHSSSSSSSSENNNHNDNSNDNDERHSHSHSDLHKKREAPSPPSSHSRELHIRQEPVPDVVDARDIEDTFVTHVVQTVSVVQVVDSAGSAIEIQTHYAPPATIVVDPVSGLTETLFSGTDPAAATPESDPVEIFPVTEPELESDFVPEIPPIPTSDVPGLDLVPGLLPSPPFVSSVVPVPSEDYVSSHDSIPTPAPSSNTSPSFPVIGSVGNSTRPGLLPSSLFNNSSSFLVKAETAFASSSSSMFSSALFSTSSVGSGSTATTTTRTRFTTTSSTSQTGASTEQEAGVEGAPGFDPTPLTTSSQNEESDDSAPATGVVVGSVVGSIAGAAVLVFLVLFALKMRKRKHGRIMLSGGPRTNHPNGSRGLLPGTDGPSAGDGGMTQRSVGLGAALAGFSPKRISRNRNVPPPTEAGVVGEGEAERGFYRVSGRKLPPVILNGGDGYTAPRASTMSGGESVYYRESRSFFDGGSPGTDAPSRLALGAPMRPVSGVPIMRTGPARGVVTEENPFADPFSDDMGPLEPPPRDPTVRSINSQDGSVSRGSRGSGSRFTEDIN